MHAGNYGVDAGWWDVWKLGAEKRALYDAGAFHITKARNGEWLTTWRNEDYMTARVMASAIDTNSAQLRTAVWVAVAARLAKNKPLAEYASLMQNAGAADTGFRDTKSDTASITKVSANGIAAIRKALGPVADSNAEVRGVLAILGEQGKAGSIASARQIAADQQVLLNTFTKSGSDIATGLEKARGVVTGEKPSGMTEWAWFWQKWSWRISLGAVGLGVLLWVGRPYLAALTKGKPASDPPSSAISNGRRRNKRGKR